MNGKTLLVILVIAILLVALYFLYFVDSNRVNTDVDRDDQVDNGDNFDNKPVTATGRGVVASINIGEVALDGPYIITTLGDATTLPFVITVPSMGINLCSARAAIVDIASLDVGDEIEVRGNMATDGTITPCEESDHYLRVVDQT